MPSLSLGCSRRVLRSSVEDGGIREFGGYHTGLQRHAGLETAEQALRIQVQHMGWNTLEERLERKLGVIWWQRGRE